MGFVSSSGVCAASPAAGTVEADAVDADDADDADDVGAGTATTVDVPAVGCCGGSDVLVDSALVGLGDWLADWLADWLGERDGFADSDCVGVGLAAERVGVGLAAERVGVGLTAERVGLGGVLVGESDAVTDGLSAAPPPWAPQPARSDSVKAHSKVQGATRGTTGNLRPPRTGVHHDDVPYAPLPHPMRVKFAIAGEAADAIAATEVIEWASLSSEPRFCEWNRDLHPGDHNRHPCLLG